MCIQRINGLPRGQEGLNTVTIKYTESSTGDIVPIGANLQTMFPFFIETGEAVKMTSPCHSGGGWSLKILLSPSGGIIGYVSIYTFLHPITNLLLPRICQVLVLPPYQAGGYGTILLESVYASYRGVKTVGALTYEDPCFGMRVLRDVMEYRMVRSLIEGNVKKKGYTVGDACAELKLPESRIERLQLLLDVVGGEALGEFGDRAKVSPKRRE